MEKETVYRLTKDDFKMVIKEYYPHLTEEQIEEFIEYARQKFEILDWTDYVIESFRNFSERS